MVFQADFPAAAVCQTGKLAPNPVRKTSQLIEMGELLRHDFIGIRDVGKQYLAGQVQYCHADRKFIDKPFDLPDHAFIVIDAEDGTLKQQQNNDAGGQQFDPVFPEKIFRYIEQFQILRQIRPVNVIACKGFIIKNLARRNVLERNG